MKREWLKNDKNKKRDMQDGLLGFTGERLPQYRWLQRITLTEEPPAGERER